MKSRQYISRWMPALKLAGAGALLLLLGAASPSRMAIPRPSLRLEPAKVQALMHRVGAVKPATDLLFELPNGANQVDTPAPIVRRLRVIRMEVTAYCPCKKCCGPNAQGVTASGLPVSYRSGRFVAADTDVLPFGTRLIIPGYDAGPVEVIDRGGAIKGRKLDVYYPSHERALEWGRQWLDVTVVE